VRLISTITTSTTLCVLLSDHVLAAGPTNTTLRIPSSRPPFAEKLSQGLIGFSIEMDRWTSWAGESVGKPNLFVNQVLGVMESFTGVPPPFRVGGPSSSPHDDRLPVSAGG
jgi:hypothetical protein